MEQLSFDHLPEAVNQLHKKLDNLERLFLAQHTPTPSDQVEYLTREQTAKLLGISLQTLNTWTKKGVIPAYRIESRVRYIRTEIEASLSKVKAYKHSRS